MKLFSNRSSVRYLILAIALLARFVSFGQVANEKYVLDKKESVVEWKSGMAAYKDDQAGYVYILKGDLTFEKGQLVGGTIEIDMKSIENKDKLDQNSPIKHIKSEDFFDVEKFPISTFVITRVTAVNSENIKVTGNLTIKSVTQPITFPAKIKVEGGVVHASGKVVIDRTQWGIRYKSGKFYDNLADEAILDDIGLEMKIVARRN
jgi:polyisoprenoid-binding protein YceI